MTQDRRRVWLWAGIVSLTLALFAPSLLLAGTDDNSVAGVFNSFTAPLNGGGCAK